jgi:hypothetical protein
MKFIVLHVLLRGNGFSCINSPLLYILLAYISTPLTARYNTVVQCFYFRLIILNNLTLFKNPVTTAPFHTFSNTWFTYDRNARCYIIGDIEKASLNKPEINKHK